MRRHREAAQVLPAMEALARQAFERARRMDVEGLRRLLERHSDLNARFPGKRFIDDNLSEIHPGKGRNCDEQAAALVRLLIESGSISVDDADEVRDSVANMERTTLTSRVQYGNTLAHMLACHDRWQALDVLLSFWPDCSIRNDNRDTAFHLAADGPTMPELLVQKFVDCSGDVNVRDRVGHLFSLESRTYTRSPTGREHSTPFGHVAGELARGPKVVGDRRSRLFHAKR
jgi:ankyrin repeat protein